VQIVRIQTIEIDNIELNHEERDGDTLREHNWVRDKVEGKITTVLVSGWWLH
jgi:hypothetical protein